ncbi:hypothetical protein PX554_19985 [Sphingomonas sp. H39-1-10]|uniref:hypothetical protein n=1 Tax=Sphingomonas pollutisoli TaxID=3030829 RepID=UPI0023B8D5AA|nr:hypothetical protein [Sphingomonas pollutisoli]MDF0490413.1 hypothetical protein [Sphingomonas pollutisoli]
MFDAPLAAHHRLIGRWAAARDMAVRRYTRVEARRHIERVFSSAVLDILRPIELADFRVVVLHGTMAEPPALALICDDLGQLDLGWIEDSDAPIAWRAAVYRTLEQTLGCVLPVFAYGDLFEEMSMYYWEGETDDEAARECLIHHQGVDPDEIDEQALPSAMRARRPDWMIGDNAAPSDQLPAGLRRKLDTLDKARDAVTGVPPDQDIWHVDREIVGAYLPGYDECAPMPPLTLVPFEQFARELDDLARQGMEMGFMDVAGFCQLEQVDRIDGWFASLTLGAQFLLAVQDLVQLDPTTL